MRVILWATSLWAAGLLLVSPAALAQQPQGPLPPLPTSEPAPPPEQAPPPPGQPAPPPPQYGPAPQPYAQPYAPPPPQYNPAPAPAYNGPPVGAPEGWAGPEVPTHAPKFSLWLGARLGAIGFGGYFYTNELGNGETTGNFVNPGPSLEVDVGARLGRRYIPYLFWEHAFLGAGHRFDGATNAGGAADFAGLGFRYVAGDVNSAGFLTDLAIGIRTITVSNNGDTYKMSALELFRLGLGAEIRFSTLFTISPLAWISGGTMNDTSGTVTYSPNGQGDGLSQPTYRPGGPNGQTINNQRGYLVVGIGCGAHFDFFGK